MKILRLRNKVFSDKIEDETKLKTIDRLGIWGDKLEWDKEHKRRYLEGKENFHIDPKGLAIHGALTGSVFAIPATKTPMELALDKRYKDAAVLSTMGVATNHLIGRAMGSFNKRKLRKNPHANDKALDRLNVAEGKMTKSEFSKKWYKKD